MGAKRVWAVVPAAALGAALGIVVGAPAATHPSAKVVSAKVSGSSVVFTVDVTLSSKACRGTAKLSAAGRHWKGAAKRGGGACHARIHGKLPKSDYGRTLTFHIAFAGKSRAAKLKLVPPTPGGSGPPDYVNGSWVQNGSFPGAGAVSMTVTGGEVAFIAANLQVRCDSDNQAYSLGYSFNHHIGVLPDGSFNGSFHYNPSGVDLQLSASGTLGNGTGTLTISATGSDFGQAQCHGSATGPIAKS